MSVTLRSCAKINLGLAIGPSRTDGFHALTTLYQTLEAHDLVTVTVIGDAPLPGHASEAGRPENRITLSSNDRRVPRDGRNTVWKMLAQALAPTGRERLRVTVHIEKRLPIQGGLGGGSANAAAALLGLERELARHKLAPPLPGDERLRLAAAVGSDVPLFLLGGTVLGLGRGEQVVPLGDLAEPDTLLHAVVALPEEGVSTPAAFRAWDERGAALGLTPERMADRLGKLQRAFASAWAEQHASGVPATSRDQAGTLSALVQTGILLNDFEEVVFRQHPLLAQIKRALAGSSGRRQAFPERDTAAYAALSGSGSAVFGLYTDPEAALAAERRLEALAVRSLRTKAVSRAEYWSGMVVEER